MTRKLLYILVLLLTMVQGAWAEETTQWTFNYTGDVQTFTAPVTGYYTLECYGAQGGYASSGLGGKGGLSRLTYPLTQEDVLYIYVGGQGDCIDGSSSHPTGGDGGWNGGGKGGTGVAWSGGNGAPYNGGGGGGGATHIATSAIGAITSITDLNANHNGLLLIAGGGGGGLSWGTSAGGVGGGDTGGNGHRGNDEWNIAWNNGTLSCGRDGMTSSNGGGSCEGCGGGGGGYVGGNTWTVSYNASNQSYSGAGGSSWGDETNGTGYTTTAGGATEGGNGKAVITLLLQGSGTAENPYLISSEEAWNFLADQVNAGNTYLGKHFRLTADISVTTMVGNSESNSFRGTFDGDGHTMTISYNTTSDYTAPFRYIQGATFKNLKVTGSITTTMNLAAGIAGLNTGSTATFERCVTDVAINSSSTTIVGWGRVDYHGGLLARTNNVNVNITDCVCGGSVDGSSSTISYCAGFVGVAVGCTVTGTRCLNTTSYTNVSITNSLCHTAEATRSVDVFYYVNGNDGVCPGTQVTASQLADGTIFTALEAGCAESIWAQDPITNQPMLKLFANDGKLPGEFTINAGGGKVRFSRGNLQYQASTNTWRFADNQYDNIGNNNRYISSSYSGWIDLFGWGTSGYNHGAVCYQPWSASTTNTDYYPYGSATANLYDGDGKADWGYNAISNGGNTENYGWRTPMKEEWEYLFNTRTTTSGIRYAKATVNGVTGVILLPDDWDASYYALTNTNTANAGWSSNTITASDWAASLEAHGAVFLPTSGNRDGANSPSSGFVSCWSSNYEVGQTNYARVVYIPGDGVYPDARGQRSTGNPVRLVYEPPYFQGAGTEADPYLISSEADWNYLAGKVNTGYTFSGKYFRLADDISVTTMVGNSESNSFRGTFDGNGHTLTVNYNTTEGMTGPFRYARGATIMNLHTAGTITTSGKFAGGLIGFAYNANTITNCRSSVFISSSVSGDGTHGGFIGDNESSESVTTSFEGCVFDGKLLGSNTNCCGGFVGWCSGNVRLNLTNCLYIPQEVTVSASGSQTFSRTGSEILNNLFSSNTNSYYTQPLGGAQGMQARSINAGTDVTISSLGAPSATYNISGITAYAHGIKYNEVYYAGNGDAVSLTLSHGDKASYTFSQYSVTGGGTLANPTTNTPTLNMTDANQTINAEWTKNEVTLTDGGDLSALTTWAGKTCTVTYSRSFTSGKPSTVCLPFAYTKKVGDGSFYAFTGITKENGSYVATMTEPAGSTLTANTPYLYLPSETGDVDFGGTYAIPAELTAGSTTSGDWTFLGTYETVSWTEAPKGIYGFSAQNVDAQGISQGEFVKVGAYVRVRPMRCYLKYKNGSENYTGAPSMAPRRAAEDETLPETISVRLVNANGSVTAIGTLHTKTGEVKLDGWYTLDGMKLSGKPTAKGIYVNNGKKYIIK